MNNYLFPAIVFVFVLIGLMVGATLILNLRQGQSLDHALFESFVLGVSLLVCAGVDYLLIVREYA